MRSWSHKLSAGRPCERRDPSPLASKVKKGLYSSAKTRFLAVWVPAFAGTTRRNVTRNKQGSCADRIENSICDSPASPMRGALALDTSARRSGVARVTRILRLGRRENGRPARDFGPNKTIECGRGALGLGWYGAAEPGQCVAHDSVIKRLVEGVRKLGDHLGRHTFRRK